MPPPPPPPPPPQIMPSTDVRLITRVVLSATPPGRPAVDPDALPPAPPTPPAPSILPFTVRLMVAPTGQEPMSSAGKFVVLEPILTPVLMNTLTMVLPSGAG